MKQPRTWKKILLSDLGILVLIATVWFIILTLVNILASGQYGFHRDELAALDNGRHLAWGYVEYPPLTPLLAHLALVLFGSSPVGFRFFPILTTSVVLVLVGLIAREMGGSRRAQVIATLASACAPILLFDALFFSYQTWDYFWWVLIAFLLVRLLKTEDPRWWLGIGVCIGLGMMTKFTMIYWVIGIAAGVLFTPTRRHLKSPWLWGGAALALLIYLPNLVWQVQHHFISLEFLGSIHARDVRIGRSDLLSYLSGQLYICVNIAATLLWFYGLWYCGFRPEGKRYRPLAYMYATTFLLFLVTQGRHYYLAAAYPMLLAAGSCWLEQRLARLPERDQRNRRNFLYAGLAVGGGLILAMTLPLAPVNSGWWKVSMAVNGELREETGWQEIVATVHNIYTALPEEQQMKAGILVNNFGEAGAVNLYGPAYGLPEAISGINSYWLRGYGDPPPEILIVLGMTQQEANQIFESCTLAGHTSNRYGIANEETTAHPDIFICSGLRQPWPDFWKSFLHFG
jgi:4-amino-4-deoxy-L-arabinose transferase-like glycosyltransferase